MCCQDWEGNPTNVMVQKDASEFLTMLFQQMESKMQGSKQEHIIRDCFGGKFANEMIAPGHYAEGEDVYSFLSIDVKNKKVGCQTEWRDRVVVFLVCPNPRAMACVHVYRTCERACSH